MKSTLNPTRPASDLVILARLCLLFKPHLYWIVLGIFLALITILANVGLLAISGWFIASMAVAGLAGELLNYITMGAGIRGCATARSASRYGERLVTHEATFKILAELRHWFYLHLEPLAPAILQKYHSGDLLSRIRADIDTLENAYVRILAPLFTALIAGSLFVFFLSWFDYRLALIELIFLLIGGLLVPLLINRLCRQPGKKLIETAAQLRQHTIDSMHGMGELLIYGGAEQQAKKINTLSQKLQQQQAKMVHYNGIAQAVLGLCASLALLLVMIVAIPLVTTGELPAVSLAMLALFTLASFEAIFPLPMAFQQLPETLTAARRIFAIVDAKPLVTEPESPSPRPKHFDIQFNQVTFGYDSKEKKVLENFSFNLGTGSHLAIVGRSGAGKSSIINLLLRFWEIEGGEILFGGHPLEHYKGDDIRQYFSVVTQNSQFFNNTIRENLLLAKRNASDEQLQEVCKVAQIHDFIMTLPEGYDTWTGEAGLKLSGGQLKRITIARALLKDAEILILDEPGEGLDRKTEKALLNSVFKYKKDKSILLITHHKITAIDSLNIDK